MKSCTPLLTWAYLSDHSLYSAKSGHLWATLFTVLRENFKTRSSFQKRRKFSSFRIFSTSGFEFEIRHKNSNDFTGDQSALGFKFGDDNFVHELCC
jgi:hypothetical protein